MSGQRIGFQHKVETKVQISATLKGRRPAGFTIIRDCPICGVKMNAPNLGRHLPACEAKAKSGLFPELSVKQLKALRIVLKQYGITPERYYRMWSRQGGLCTICGRPELMRRFSVDHCHQTKAVRGLLCSSCNRLLGEARDRPSVLRRAAAYLEMYGTDEPIGCDCPEFDPFKD